MLETTWFILWGLLWAIYFILDGFDLGLGTLLPFLAKDETEKRIMYNAAGPFWDGNEVWLITAGGVTFAAFPKAYAVMFSALYAPLLILLFALIFRAVSYEFRHMESHPLWTAICDRVHFVANLLPALLLGVAFANLFMGIPIDQNGVYHGNILKLLNPYGLAGGIFFVCMFCMHGALWLAIKSEGKLQSRAIATALLLWPVLLGLLLAFLGLTAVYTNLYANYLTYPALIALPVLALVGLVGARVLLSAGKLWFAWAASGVFILGVTFFGVAGMYPGIVISSLNPEWSVTILNGASSTLTLKIMLGVALVCVPIVIAYQAWTYYIFSDKVTKESMDEGHSY